MGYRSQVVLAISKHLTPFLTLACSQNAEAEALVFKYSDHFEKNYENEKSWLIRWDSIKWYDSFEEVQTICKFIDEAICDEYQFEIEGEIQFSAEHIKFVRVGEESGDIEMLGDGFWDIYPSTTICY